MKKSLLCLVLSLTLIFSACAAAHAVTMLKIGVCVDQMSDAETRAFCDMLQTFFAAQETDEIKYELFFADAGGSVEQQKGQIDSLLKQKLDLILINFLDNSAVEAASEKLKASGTPAVLFGQHMIVRDGNGYMAHASVDDLLDQIQGCYVGGDLRQASLMQGRILEDRPYHGDINQDGVIRYVIIRDSVPRSESRLRTDLSLRAAGNAGLEAVCLSDRSGAEDQEQARSIFENLILEYGTQIEAVICTHDYIAAGVAQAIQEAAAAQEVQEADGTVSSAGYADICVLGMDGTEEALQLIRENKIAGTVLIDDAAQERAVQEAILKILNGEEIQKYYWEEYRIITSQNVDTLDRIE